MCVLFFGGETNFMYTMLILAITQQNKYYDTCNVGAVTKQMYFQAQTKQTENVRCNKNDFEERQIWNKFQVQIKVQLQKLFVIQLLSFVRNDNKQNNSGIIIL
eukprot:TRINITY_DN27907_c0_g1_i1.p3 TRINITY_DN27907_c0_g1~~TRINITY_DN27907_c0_g1_i1.p3  ORF type:complete len:103 (-),score=2.12 TRINITY_DN27907_c0_g1_i1:317-625(-)